MIAIIVKMMTITGRSICSVNSYCDNDDNNGEIYTHCVQLLYNYGINGEICMQC